MTERQRTSSKLKGPFLVASLALGMVVLVFGVIVGIASFQLRSELRERVVQRHAEIWSQISRFQVARGLEDNLLGFLDTEDAIMYSLMAAQDIEGSLGVQLFDENGNFLSGVPVGMDDSNLSGSQMDRLKGMAPWGNFEAVRENDGGSGESYSKLEIFVPLVENGSDELVVLARYIMDGELVGGEFDSIDEKLAKQAAWAFLSGTILVSAVFLLSFYKLRRANREVEVRAQRLAQANAELAMVAKTSAIGAVASHLIHGLKNPLAGISQHIASGGEGLESDDWNDANHAAKRMKEMINEVVDVLKNDDFDDLETLSNDEIAAVLRRKFEDRAQKKGLEFTVLSRGEDELSARVANISKLIVSNLVENAIDATPVGGEIEVRIEEKEGDIAFSVLDAGTGFSESARENMFFPCQSSKTAGAGIGLAISKQLARHIGADLKLDRSSAAETVMLLSVPLFGQH